MRTTQSIATLVALMLGALSASAFSLLGPMVGWQAPDLGYNIPDSAPEYGGPRLRGDEYRLSTPIVTYGIDGSFLEFFGVDGARAVDEAFEVFNSITNVSAFSQNLEEFPLKADGVNPTAAALGLLDLKTQLMGQILATMGLTSPERWCWSIRARAVDPIRYSVVNFNYDPVSGRPSRYINGTLYSYVLRDIFNDAGARIFSDAREIPVDSANPNVSLASTISVASFITSDERVSRAIDTTGRYFTGLTRDDAGGLRYLYHPANRNYEQAPAGSIRGSVSSGGGGGGGALESPWTIAGDTGQVGTTAVATTGTSNVLQLVNLGVRAGVDRVRFVKVNTDPVLRQNARQAAVTYPEVVSTNGVVIRQVVSRVLTRPDILISARDLGVATYVPLIGALTLPTFVNTGATLDGLAEGPGNVEPVSGYTFSKVGVHSLNIGNTDEQDGQPGSLWGSFNGTTNAPVLYPVGSRLSDLEAAALYLRRN
ncbi:MAG: hypothetical protein RIT19_1395 [Verrucomicrobiota bacterium]|jgi:hypothetical protein